MSSNNEGAGGAKGENASITYNGLDISRPSNTFQINGVEITIKQKTTDTITFSSTADVDSILDTITQFVNKYNEIIKRFRIKQVKRNIAPLPRLLLSKRRQ